MVKTPGSAGSTPRRRAAFLASSDFGRGAAKLCVRSRRYEDERNVSFVRLGRVEMNPVTRRLQIVFVVKT